MEECQQCTNRQRDHVIPISYDNVVSYRDTLHLVILGGYVMYRIWGNGNMAHRTYQCHTIQHDQQISSDYEQG